MLQLGCPYSAPTTLSTALVVAETRSVSQVLFLKMPFDFKKVLKYLWQTLWVPSQEPSFLFVEDRSQVPSPMLKRQQSAMPQGMSQGWWKPMIQGKPAYLG